MKRKKAGPIKTLQPSAMSKRLRKIAEEAAQKAVADCEKRIAEMMDEKLRGYQQKPMRFD